MKEETDYDSSVSLDSQNALCADRVARVSSSCAKNAAIRSISSEVFPSAMEQASAEIATTKLQDSIKSPHCAV